MRTAAELRSTILLRPLLLLARRGSSLAPTHARTRAPAAATMATTSTKTAARAVRRRATHAGSWYLSDRAELDAQLTAFLGNVPGVLAEHGPLPVPDARIIIAPHAGYSYSGPTAAWAYKSWDVSQIDRVFLLGPSHHIYLNNCALSECTEYATPLGNIPLDLQTIADLSDSGKFTRMSRATDEDEHSLEMHLPYIYKMLSESPRGIRPLVPIMVGALSAQGERDFGQLLSPYLADPRNAFVISSDFCHWGLRFSYTNYVDDAACEHVHTLRRSGDVRNHVMPIYKSIEIMDYKAMDTATEGSHAAWSSYLSHTKNTICGRHPIGVVLAGTEYLRTSAGVELTDVQRRPVPGTRSAEVVAREQLSGEDALKYSFGKIFWVQYKQSSHCERLEDSSVSYASGFARA
ncbi:memo-like protein-domain-containing protein [Limtongia smithiae]|uniref:memo-like protein-domain-containing protein n=1 Tax=Limtongia smithiae TaxID=1125753 RepID=UPI0034CD5C0E